MHTPAWKLASLLSILASAVAIPTGPLYAKRFPSDFDARLREVLSKRQMGGQSVLDDPLGSGIANVTDPVSNTTAAHSPPIYRALTPFDYASFNLGIYQEYIELDLFHYGLARFSDQEFDDAGITAQYRSIINFMANQEVAHATLLGSILGPGHAQQCSYAYQFDTVRGFIDFCQRLTRWGESGVYGFLSKLNSADSATLLTNSIVTEARQQEIFRQLEGAFPMPEAFVPGIPQTWQWTLLAPYITSCPTGTPRIQWSNYPALNVTSGPDGSTPTLLNSTSQAAVSTNETTQIISGGEQLSLTWESPGQTVGPDQSYKTSINSTGVAQYAAFVTQLNTTYAALQNVTKNSATVIVPAYQPIFSVVPDIGVLNSTGFVVITDSNPYVTPYNLSLLNAHVVAGPSMIQFG